MCIRRRGGDIECSSEYHRAATCQDIAAEAGTVPSTVVRCCKRLGFDGFLDLKMALVEDALALPEPARVEHDLPAAVLAAGAAALGEASAAVDRAAFRAAAAALGAAHTVLVVGAGRSAALAQGASFALVAGGARAEAPAGDRVQRLVAALLSPADVCLAISHSGETEATVAATATAADRGATTIGITGYSATALASVASVTLVAGGRGLTFWPDEAAGRLVQAAVLGAPVAVRIGGLEFTDRSPGHAGGARLRLAHPAAARARAAQPGLALASSGAPP
jgi:DNA-binding MurR/RpiR family transcriptional regulator